MLKGGRGSPETKRGSGATGRPRCSANMVQQFIKENVNPDISNTAVKGFTRNSFNGY